LKRIEEQSKAIDRLQVDLEGVVTERQAVALALEKANVDMSLVAQKNTDG